MKSLSKKDLEHRITLAMQGRDDGHDDGAGSQTPNPVIGLKITPSGTDYRFADLLRPNARRQLWVLGSSSRCDIQLNDVYVSEAHCIMLRDRRTKRISIFDVGSKNGVRVNSTRIQAAEIEPGDTLILGATCLYAFGAAHADKEIIIAAPDHQTYLTRATEVYGGIRAAARGIALKLSRFRYWHKEKNHE